MDVLLEKYKARKPEVVFEWHDEETGAEGWIVINSLRGGAAGGGTRMRKGLTCDEVVSLAKVMEIKFSVAGPNIGGAKSGINFDPFDPRRREVLQRWYKAALPLLKYYYGTGGDLNVDELKDVTPITESLGLWHPQEGIVNGHLRPDEGQKISIIGQLRYGCTKVVENPEYIPMGNPNKLAVADLITGFGVAESVKYFYDLYKKSDLSGRAVIVQGWGNVASAAACYLAQSGARIVGIIDRAGGIIAPEGLSAAEVYDLFHKKNGNQLASPDLLPFDEVNAHIWRLGAEIFIPAAASKLITPEQADALIASGTACIACGANVPFADDEIFFGPTAKAVDRQIALIPDFIANCGMARVFAYLMQPDVALTDEAIFGDVSATIRRSMEEIFKINEKSDAISTNALYLSLKKLGA